MEYHSIEYEYDFTVRFGGVQREVSYFERFSPDRPTQRTAHSGNQERRLSVYPCRQSNHEHQSSFDRDIRFDLPPYYGLCFGCE